MIIDTIPVSHDVSPYVQLLDVEGALVIVGNLGNMAGFGSLPLVMGRRRITGSPSGGIAETREMLDFCARQGVRFMARFATPDAGAKDDLACVPGATITQPYPASPV